MWLPRSGMCTSVKADEPVFGARFIMWPRSVQGCYCALELTGCSARDDFVGQAGCCRPIEQQALQKLRRLGHVGVCTDLRQARLQPVRALAVCAGIAGNNLITTAPCCCVGEHAEQADQHAGITPISHLMQRDTARR